MIITDDIKYVGVNDHITDLFEGQYPIPNGIAYNSYAVIDEKIAIMDSVDISFADRWIKNIKSILGKRYPHYLIIQHMEPEHGIAPGTKFEDLPEDFECPICGVGKELFEEA